MLLTYIKPHIEFGQLRDKLQHQLTTDEADEDGNEKSADGQLLE